MLGSLCICLVILKHHQSIFFRAMRRPRQARVLPRAFAGSGRCYAGIDARVSLMRLSMNPERPRGGREGGSRYIII